MQADVRASVSLRLHYCGGTARGPLLKGEPYAEAAWETIIRGQRSWEKKGQLTFCIFCKYHLVFIMKDHKQELPSGGERPYFHFP